MPTDFLFLPLVVRETDVLDPPLNSHLVGFSVFRTFIVANLMQNEHLFVSHFYSWVDGFVYLEEDEWLSDSQMSASSVIHKPKNQQKKSAKVDEMVSASCPMECLGLNSG